jgi:inorganic triphosphatase YgiF
MTRCGDPRCGVTLHWTVSPNAEETELRLAISAVAATKLWKSAALAAFDAAIPRAHKLVSIYWDTPDFRLRDRGLALRVRRIDAGGWTQTLKAASRDVDTRREYEGTLAGAQPDLQLARRQGWPGDAGVLAVERKLQPTFGTRIVRTARRVRFDDGTVAEVALDRGAITIEQRRPAIRERLLEIEIELVTGRASRLYELANRLVAELPSVRLLFTSKSARGYRLLSRSPIAASRARDIEVPHDSSAALIGYRAFAESVAHVQDNVDCVRLTGDPEGVHQMRVAVRRLRVAAGIASEAGLPSLSDKLVDELRWLWALLGDCRDADVFATETWPQISGEAADGAASTAEFEANVATRRDATRRDLRRALGARRCQFIMLSLAWIAARQREALATSTRRPGPRRLSRRMLSRRTKRIVDIAVDELTDEQRHRVRIDAKKLRYLAEFVAGLYARRDTRRYLRRLAAVQAALGGLNDLAAVDRWVETGTSTLPTRERRLVARLCRDYALQRAPALDRELTDAWGKLGRTEPFWT